MTLRTDGTLRELDFRRRSATPVVAAGLVLAVALLTAFAIAYNPFDFNVYRWGGDVVTSGMRLYDVQINTHWFTYPPFAAVVFIPIAAIPDTLGRLAFELASLAALAYSAAVALKLAGYRPSWRVTGAVAVIAMTLEPMYHTFYLGQINLILLAFILADVWRAARGKPAGLGVGIAAAIKLTPLIFIALFFLAARTKAGLTAAATFVVSVLIGYLVAPGDSGLYWHKLFDDTKRVGAPYISNQSPYAMALRVAGGAAHVGHWYLVIPLLLGVAGLAIAAVLARHDDWLGAATVTGVTGLLVSPISWTHHWVWILPALVILVLAGRPGQIAAAGAYLLFVIAPMWFTPRHGGPHEYGFHWLLTLVANCYLVAALAFGGFMGRRAWLLLRRPAQPGQPGALADGDVPAGNPAARSATTPPRTPAG